MVTKQDLKAQKQRTLKNYYATLDAQRRFVDSGEMVMAGSCDLILEMCLARLRALRFQEIYAGWPLLLPPAFSSSLN